MLLIFVENLCEINYLTGFYKLIWNVRVRNIELMKDCENCGMHFTYKIRWTQPADIMKLIGARTHDWTVSINYGLNNP